MEEGDGGRVGWGNPINRLSKQKNFEEARDGREQREGAGKRGRCMKNQSLFSRVGG